MKKRKAEKLPSKIYKYLDLPDRVQIKVVRTMRSWLNEVYKILTVERNVAEMLQQINPSVEFYIHQDGRKLFRIDDSDERLAKYMGDQFAAAARHDKRIMDKILINMIKRNDGDERLIIR